MARFRLKRFCDLEFLRSIDKRGPLAWLLARHRAYFASVDVPVGKRANDDATTRVLLTSSSSPMKLYPANSSGRCTIDAASDVDGEAPIFEEAERFDIQAHQAVESRKNAYC